MNRIPFAERPFRRYPFLFLLISLASVLFFSTACGTFRSKDKDTDLETMKKEMEDMQKSMAQINLKMANLENQVEFLEARLNEMGQRESIPSQPGDQATQKPETRPETESPQKSGEGPDYASLSPEELYQQAIISINQKNYPLGVRLLRKFVAENPASDLADKAQFWVGEAFFLQKEFTQAIHEYSLVIENYPDGNYAPDAYLKTAMAFEEMKRPEQAKNTLRELLERFPDSSAAKVAKMKLTKKEKE